MRNIFVKITTARFFAPTILIFIAILLCAIAIKLLPENNTAAPPIQIDYGLPVIYINTTDGNYPFNDDKNVTFEATMNIYDSTLQPTKGTLYTGKITLKTRGNTSRLQEKTSWNIKLDYKSQLLNLNSTSKDWCLISNCFDYSLMRNHLAYELARDMAGYAVDSSFVDVVINGEYCGNYLLCERPTLENDRIGAGGYLVELTERRKVNLAIPFIFLTTQINGAQCFSIKEPSYRKISIEACKYIARYMNNFENILYSESWLSPENGYKTIIDISSIVDAYIINELFSNSEFFYASTYFYIPQNGLMTLGPIWDFDWSTGNYWQAIGDPLDVLGYSRWAGYLPRLFEDPEFEPLIKARWQEIYKTAIPAMFERLDETKELIATSAEKNFEVYPFEEPNDWATWDEEARYLRSWLKARVAWLNSEWGA